MHLPQFHIDTIPQLWKLKKLLQRGNYDNRINSKVMFIFHVNDKLWNLNGQMDEMFEPEIVNRKHFSSFDTVKPCTQVHVFLDKFLGSFTCSCVQWTSCFFRRFCLTSFICSCVQIFLWQIFPWQFSLFNFKSWHDHAAFEQGSLSRKNLSNYAVHTSQ